MWFLCPEQGAQTELPHTWPRLFPRIPRPTLRSELRRCAMRQSMSKTTKGSEDRNVLEFDLGFVSTRRAATAATGIRWEERRQANDTSAKDQIAAIEKAQDVVERLRRSIRTELGRAKGAHLVGQIWDPPPKPSTGPRTAGNGDGRSTAFARSSPPGRSTKRRSRSRTSPGSWATHPHASHKTSTSTSATTCSTGSSQRAAKDAVRGRRCQRGPTRVMLGATQREPRMSVSGRGAAASPMTRSTTSAAPPSVPLDISRNDSPLLPPRREARLRPPRVYSEPSAAADTSPQTPLLAMWCDSERTGLAARH